MKTLGIIGGLGPMATAQLLRLIIAHTDAATDQEHVDCIVFNRPDVPDRTAYILDHSKPSPLPAMQATARSLEALGCGVLCTPCVTAHYFHRELQGCVSIPLLHMPEETAAALAMQGKRRVGILATTGTVRSGLFQTALDAVGIQGVLPDETGQALVMSMIYDDIKAGKPAAQDKLDRVTRALWAQGCESIILGCTELSLIGREQLTAAPGDAEWADALEILACRCVESCGARVKKA